ncbi:aminotransferase class V-fold PLP-dependent enzyme [Methanopyrus kandleri]|uniref:Selenocysteine lyase n=2 Tax=Methanopyrus kandleri TaxID=2320 RepID=Q8TVF5_METKA|nr:aminotransferase class V-fold PLP-dependent enzyme [Methanopyrus kandleri]AAM02650.1 Selenocysteine lyase [Methanopyrus kandleri AV19]HII70231.1 aminotransferase class V-fold PLP-dependent enzyme [Methanopyrus kandleri]
MGLDEIVNGFPLKEEWVYLDNAATSLKHERVISAMERVLREFGVNVGRGAHPPGECATEEFERARDIVASFLGVEPECLAFTLNTTHSIHYVLASIRWKKGDAVVTTALEHHSNLAPWLRFSEVLGFEVEVVGFDRETGEVDMAELESVVDDNTRLIAITHESNALGSLQPVDEILELAEEVGAYVLLDAAQSLGHMDHDWSRYHFLAAPGHKGLLGPHGTGILYVREDVMEELELRLLGGGSTDYVTRDLEVVPREPPLSFESGTPNLPGVIGLAEGVKILEEVGLNRVERRIRKVTRRILNGLEELEGVEILAPEAERKTIVPFLVDGVDYAEVGKKLGERNICVRTGRHCASLVFERLGLDGCVRASVAFYNDIEEAERFLEVVEEIARGS